MAGRRAGAGLALAAVALSAAGCSIGGGGGTTTTVTRTLTRTVTITRTVTQSASSAQPCTSSQLSGTFTLIPGSGAAGQISYALKLTNTARTARTGCTFQGASTAALLSASGSALPTHIEPTTGIGLVGAQLSPGTSTVVPARFSPSVPGTGDSQSGPCQPKAYTLRVTLNGGGTVDAPIKPPTSVCQRGTLNFDASQTP